MPGPEGHEPTVLQADQDDATATEPAPAARVGDLTGLLEFLNWMQAQAESFDRSPSSVRNVYETWRLAERRLQLPGTTPIDDADLAAIARSLVSTRYGGTDPQRTAQAYASRLARGRQWHQSWRAADPLWMRRTYTPNPVATRRQRLAQGSRVRFDLPLRDDRTTTVILPTDLTPDETDMVCAWLRTLAGSARGGSPEPTD